MGNLLTGTPFPAHRKSTWTRFGLTLLCLIAGAARVSGQSQPHELSLRDVPVEAALEQVVSLTGINLIFSSEVGRDRTTLCRIRDSDPEKLLRCVVHGAGLDYYRLSSGTYVVINSPEDVPAYGTFTGQVLDRITGEPVANASLEVPGGRHRSLTNDGGYFVLPGLLPGRLEVHVSRMGYTPIRLPITVAPSGNERRQIRLTPVAVELDPILVEGMERIGGGLSELLYPAGLPSNEVGPSRDMAGVLRAGMGVSRRPLFADLSIQGSAPGETVVRLDGVPVFDPVSLGRSRSAFSPLALRRITLRRAGYAAEHGSHSGGIVDLEHAVSAPDGRAGVTALFDPYSINASLSTPIRILGGDGSLMIAGRESMWDIYREASLDETLREWNQVDPVLMRSAVGDRIRFADALVFQPNRQGSDLDFSDIHVATRLRFSDFRTFDASFYRGTNRVETELLSASSEDASDEIDRIFLTADHYSWSNTMAQASMDFLVGTRSSIRGRVWGSQHELVHRYGIAEGADVGFDPNQGPDDLSVDEAHVRLRTLLADGAAEDDGNRLEELGFEVTGDLAAGGGHFLSGGAEVVRVESVTHLLNGFVRPVTSRTNGWRLSGFLQDRWSVTRSLTLNGGVRYTSLGDSRVYAEPRGSVRLDGRSGSLGTWSFRVAGGLYRQYLNQFEITNLGPSALVPQVRFWIPASSDGGTAPARSRHLSAELAFRPWRNWEIRVESYHKWLDRIMALDYALLLSDSPPANGDATASSFIGESSGVAYGTGIWLGWDRETARVRVSYDWSVSRRTFPSRFDGREQPVPWNGPHAMRLQVRYPIFGGFSIEGESNNTWGRTWALRQAYYDFLTVQEVEDGPVVGLPGGDPLPSLHFVDLGVSWLSRVGGAVAEFRMEVRNALTGRQIFDHSLRRIPASSGAVQYEVMERLYPGTSLLISGRIGI